MDVDHILSSSSSSSSSNSELDLFLNFTIHEFAIRSVPKNENYVEDTIAQFTDDEFKTHFRTSNNIARLLAEKWEHSNWSAKHDTGYERISSEKCILIYLWYAGHTCSFREVADRFDVSLSTLHGIVENVTMFLSELPPQVIKWPTEEEKQETINYYRNTGFPDVIGCLDGSHIKIDKPDEDHESYFNRKKYYSIQVQCVCDHKRKIIDFFTGFPGSVHDSRVFKNSPLSNNLEEKCGNNYIIADSAYPCLRHLLTPYKDTGAPTNVEKHFNKNLSKCRVSIEHTFGILKQKWRQLYHIKLRKIDMISHFIRAMCVLHNICIEDELENVNVLQENEIFENVEIIEDEGNPAGHNFRNYIASVLF